MKQYTFLALFATLLVLVADTSSASAAAIGSPFGSSSGDVVTQITNFSNVDNNFQTMLRDLAHAIIGMSREIVTIMTIIAAAMWSLSVQDGQKLLWNYIFGIGVALNASDFLFSLYNTFIAGAGVTIAAPTFEGFTFKTPDNPNVPIVGPLINYFIQCMQRGAQILSTYAVNMTLLFAIITTSLNFALELNGGDKIHALVKTLLQTGFYLFLILNWVGGMNVCHSLLAGFESMAYVASGASDLVASAGSSELVTAPDQIITSAFSIFLAAWDAIKWTSPLIALVHIISMVASFLLLCLTALEVIITRLEFWVMVTVSIILLPFGMIPQLKFLADKAIGGIINCAIKMFTVTFLGTIGVTMLNGLAKETVQMVQANKDTWFDDITMTLSTLLFALVMFFVVKQIPKFTAGLLNGSPSLSGNDMRQAALEVAAKTSAAAGAVKGAAEATGGMGKWGGHNSVGKNMLSMAGAAGGMGARFAANLGKAGAGSATRPLTQSFKAAKNNALRANGIRPQDDEEFLKAYKELVGPSKSIEDKFQEIRSGQPINNAMKSAKNTIKSTGNKMAHPIDSINSAVQKNFGRDVTHNAPDKETNNNSNNTSDNK